MASRIVPKLAARSDISDRELQGWRARQIRPRLQEPRAGKSAADLLLGHRLRAGRPLRHARRLRPDGAGHGRHYGPDRHADGPPTRVGVAISDIFTGIYSVVGILAALAEREKTGKGAYVDTALVEFHRRRAGQPGAQLSCVRRDPQAHRQLAPNIVPYQEFPAADGHIIIATGNDNQYVKFCNVLGAPELANDPAYKDNIGRLTHREELIEKLTALTRKHDTRRSARQARRCRRAGRPDQRPGSGVQRSAGQASRHEARFAKQGSQSAVISRACARRS